MIEDLVLQSKQFQAWRQSVEASGTKIDELKILGAISRDEQTLFSAFVDCVMTTPEGNKVPRCLLLRGRSVVIVPVFYCEEEEVFTLMVQQRRPVDGEFALEFPGGLIEAKECEPIQVAVREIQEELDLHVIETEIKPLCEKPVKVCASMMDEMVHFFYFEKQCSISWLQSYQDRITGHHDDGEYLTVQIIRMTEVATLLNSSVLVGLKLLEKKFGRMF